MAKRVYVIELDAEAGRRRDPRIPWVYVGSTGRPIATRFEQHKGGYRSAGLVKRHWVRLRPDLYEDIDPIRGSGEAVDAEKARARQLARAGFVAHCDGTSYGKRGGDWAEWGYRRLQPVIGHLDAAIAELVECSFRPLTVEACAHLLWGTHNFWVADHIDQDDPPPSYGLFSHVRRDALERRIGELIEGGAIGERGGALYPTG